MLPTDSDKIETLHPAGKKGVNILRRRYELVRGFIEQTVRERGPLTYQRLDELANEALTDKLDGSVSWYVVTVKLDLEARGVLERVPKTSPHQVRLVKNS